jgi:hypothetical protein
MGSGIYKFILSMLRALAALIGGAEDVLEPLVSRYTFISTSADFLASINNIVSLSTFTMNAQISDI